MSNSVYETYDEQSKIAHRLLSAVQNSDFQIKTVPKLSKTKLLKFLEITINALDTVKNIWADAEIKLVDQFDEKTEQTHIEVPDIDNKTVSIMTCQQVEKMKYEIEEIEKYYPGENALTEEEKMCKGVCNSLHDFQYFIARVRKGEAEIIINDDGSISIVQNE